MYFEDLYRKEMKDYGYSIIKVGWLDVSKQYVKGKVPNEVIEILKKIKPIVHTKGWHDCPFCNNAISSREYIINKSDNEVYNAPEMIIHYVEEHDYLPPQEFIDVVLKLRNK